MKFEQAVEIILHHEGGYVNDPRDPGGETNLGIAKRSYPMLDIKSLTKEKAAEIYRRDFWDKNQIEKLPACLRLLVFDGCVNQGGNAAIGLLQSAVGMPIDGHLSEADIEKINSFPPDQVMKKYVYFRWRRYAQNKNFAVYGGGWGRRLLDVSLECALQSSPVPLIQS